MAQEAALRFVGMQPGGPCRDVCRSSGNQGARRVPDGSAEAKWQCLPDTGRVFSARPDGRLSGTYSCRLWDTRDTQLSLCAMFLIKWPATLLVYHH